MLFNIKSNAMHPLNAALPLPYVPARVARGALFAHRHSLTPPDVEFFSITGPLCPSQYLYGMIFMTPCLIVWDWWVLRAEPISLLAGLISLFLSPSILSFISFHGLAVCGWDFRIYGVFSLSPSLALPTHF